MAAIVAGNFENNGQATRAVEKLIHSFDPLSNPQLVERVKRDAA
jgi:hypothetical protein